MKEEDFVEGKWYISSRWNAFKAAKFDKFTSIGDFHYSERIDGNKWKNIGGFTNSDKQIWSSFREVPISEIAEYLPKDHPDLKDILPRYVKWVGNTGRGNAGYQTITNFKFNKIFDTKIDNPPAGFNLYDWSIHLKTYPNNYISASEEEYNDQNAALSSFPEEGYCDKSPELYEFLQKKYPNSIITTTHCKNFKGYAWNAVEFWGIINLSGKPPYTLKQLNKFINPKKEKNVTTSNPCGEIYLPTSENTRPSISGTVAIRCGRQQITTGSRPNGNKTCSSTGRTRINHIKIIKTTIKRENY